LNDEPGRERVERILGLAKQGKCQVFVCMMNLGEMLYIIEWQRGISKAQSVLALLESVPLKLLDVTRDLILDAAHVKARHPLSYADSFVVATAQREKAIVVTGDPEFAAVTTLVRVEWLVEGK
jgi:predicted nucleic acid-binding protein